MKRLTNLTTFTAFTAFTAFAKKCSMVPYINTNNGTNTFFNSYSYKTDFLTNLSKRTNLYCQSLSLMKGKRSPFIEFHSPKNYILPSDLSSDLCPVKSQEKYLQSDLGTAIVCVAVICAVGVAAYSLIIARYCYTFGDADYFDTVCRIVYVFIFFFFIVLYYDLI